MFEKSVGQAPDLSSHLYEIRNRIKNATDSVDFHRRRLNRKVGQLLSLPPEPKAPGENLSEKGVVFPERPLLPEIVDALSDLEMAIESLASSTSTIETI